MELYSYNSMQQDNKWNNLITQWKPWEYTSRRGRSQMRWSKDVEKHIEERRG